MDLPHDQMIDYSSRKTAFKKRIKAEGRFPEVRALLDKKVAEGMDPHTAWELIMSDPEWAALVEPDGEMLPYDVDPEVFEGKTCSEEAAVTWAFGKVFIRCIGPQDAPSAVAWTYLYDAKRSREGMRELHRSMRQILPNKQQIEQKTAQKASDKKVKETLDAIAEAAKSHKDVDDVEPLGRIRPALEGDPEAAEG